MTEISNALPASIWAGGRSISDCRFAPGGDRVSFITSSSQGTEFALIDVASGAESWLPLSPRVARSSGSYAWLPDESGIAYIGADNTIYLFDFTTSTSKRIVEVDDPSALTLSPDGSRIAYVSGLQHVWVADVEENATPLRISSDADFAFDPAWSGDSQLVAWHEWDVPNMPWDGSRIVVRKADASQPIITVAGADDISVQQPRFSPDGERLVFLSDASGWLNLWAVDVATFENSHQLIAEHAEHGEPSWGPAQRSYAFTNNGRSIMYWRNANGFVTLAELDVASGKSNIVEEDFSYTEIDAKSDAVVAMAAGPARLSQLVVRVDDEERVIANASYVGIEKDALVPEAVQWHAKDGATIHGRLYRQTQQGPLLVCVHGGPTHQTSTTFYGRWNYFIERGWSLLVVDYRGTTGWGRDYAQALRGRWGELDVSDVASGIEAAIANGWVAPGQVALFGGSAGGLTILQLLVHHADLVTAAVAMYPVADLEAIATDSWRFEAHYTQTLVGDLDETREIHVERSPLTHADQIKTPLLVMHGDKDVVVPIDQSKALVERVRANGGTVEFHIYEGEGHGWKQTETRIDELERANRFLSRYVLGEATSTAETSK